MIIPEVSDWLFGQVDPQVPHTSLVMRDRPSFDGLRLFFLRPDSMLLVTTAQVWVRASWNIYKPRPSLLSRISLLTAFPLQAGGGWMTIKQCSSVKADSRAVCFCFQLHAKAPYWQLLLISYTRSWVCQALILQHWTWHFVATSVTSQLSTATLLSCSRLQFSLWDCDHHHHPFVISWVSGF